MQELLLNYTYWILLPLAIIEGPVVTLVAGFLASLGFLNVYLVYPIVLIGDIIGDTLFYFFGKHGTFGMVHKYGRWFGLTESRLVSVQQKYFTDHSSLWKIITLSKITQAPSAVVLFLCGMMHVDFKKYAVITVINNIFKTLTLLLLGYFFGLSHLFLSHNLRWAWVVLLPLFFVLLYLVSGHGGEKIENTVDIFNKDSRY